MIFLKRNAVFLVICMAKALIRVLYSIVGLQVERKWVTLTQMDRWGFAHAGHFGMGLSICCLGERCSSLKTLKDTHTLRTLCYCLYCTLIHSSHLQTVPL